MMRSRFVECGEEAIRLIEMLLRHARYTIVAHKHAKLFVFAHGLPWNEVQLDGSRRRRRRILCIVVTTRVVR